MGIATKKIYHLTGLSTDTKQIPEDISTGSTFLETDTGKTFVYNKSMNAWMLSKNVEVRQIDAPCRGILSIDLTSSAGLVDTYTIKYTNGSETTYEVVNGAFVEVNPDIKPMVKNKAYTLDINTIKYNLYKATTLTNCSIKHNIDTNTYDIISDVIDRNEFWPRKDEGFFVLKLRNRDDDFVFNFVGQNSDGQDIWQSFVVTENNDFKRYVGHFEYTDPTNIKTSDYYFVAKEQTISFKDLKESIDLEIARAKEEEESICEILNDVDTKLAEEIKRAKEAEADEYNRATAIETDLANAMINWDDLIKALRARLTKEEAYSFLATKELEHRIKKVEYQVKDKIDAINEDQLLYAKGFYGQVFESYNGPKSLLDADNRIGGRVYTVVPKANGALTGAILTVEGTPNINIKANKNLAINAIDAIKFSAKTSTEQITNEKQIIANTVNITGDTIINATLNVANKATITNLDVVDTINSQKGIFDIVTINKTANIKAADIKETLTTNIVNSNVASVKDELTVDGDTLFNKDIKTSNILPKEDNTLDIGKLGVSYKDLYLSGAVKIPAGPMQTNTIAFPTGKDDTLVGKSDFDNATQNLDDEIARALAAEEQLQANIDAEFARAKEAEDILTTDVTTINSKIPEGTDDINKLVNRRILNDAISRSAATFLGERNVTELIIAGRHLDKNASHEEVEHALTENEMHFAELDNKNNNDYINIGYLDDIPEIGYTKFERYKYVEKEILNPDTGNFEIVSGWEFEYEISHTTFTQDQWDAIKSGITKEYVDRITKTIMVEDIITASDFDSTNIDNRNDHYTATSYLEARLSDYDSNIKKYIADYTEANLTITVDDWSDINNALAAALDSANGFRY